jgi:hypothetical protein
VVGGNLANAFACRTAELAVQSSKPPPFRARLLTVEVGIVAVIDLRAEMRKRRVSSKLIANTKTLLDDLCELITVAA